MRLKSQGMGEYQIYPKHGLTIFRIFILLVGYPEPTTEDYYPF